MYTRLPSVARRLERFLQITGVVLGALLLAVPGWSLEGQNHEEPQVKAPAGKAGKTARVAGGEVVVTAPRMDIPLNENPAATTVVDRSILSVMPRTIAADEALASVPGVKVDNQANGERVHLSIRGQGILTEHGIRGIKVLLDGIPLNDPTGFVPDLYDVDWATVQRIEVLRGPASSLYGGAGSGGIINIATSDGGPGPIDGLARLDLGSHGFFKVLAQAGGAHDGMRYRFAVSRNQGNGYRVHTAFNGTNLYGKIQLRNTNRLRLTAIVAGTSFFNENAEGLNLEQVEEDPTQANPDALAYNEYQKTRRGTLGFCGQYDLSPAQRISFTVYGRHTRYRESVPSSIIHSGYDGYGGSVQYSLQSSIGSLRNHLDAGADLDWQDIDEYKRPNLGGGLEGPEIVADQLISQGGKALFAFDRLDLGHNWNIVFGARHDHIDNELDDRLKAGGVDLSGNATFSKTTARLGAAWSWRPSLGFYASWGQGFLPPATEELASNPDSLGGFNEGLRPATSHSFETGVRGQAWTRLTYEVALFRLMTHGDFGRYRRPDRPLETFYRNAGDSRRYGLETQLLWLPIDRLTLRLAYTYSHFKYDEVSIGDIVYSDTWLPNTPRQMAYLDVEYSPLCHLALGAAVDARSRAYIDGTNATWIDGYTLVHLRLKYRVHLGATGTMDVMLAIRNLTGTSYIAFTEPDPDGNSYQPGPGREYFAGVLARF
ncbi:MAG: TonB-dependent receptor [Acidobacteria bacterium]|nr:TonB-dependent receptor [Acidobacteriota bacterium]